MNIPQGQDFQQTNDFLQGLRDEFADIRNTQNNIQVANHAHVQAVRQQLNNYEAEHQNNIPGILPTVVLLSLLKPFTRENISETWQDWFDLFVLTARACN
ncbi:MAG: hypothetical protein GY853_16280, partial [PVC group bacterium]|nr:hypothetical protein [PVC group bacterium]